MNEDRIIGSAKQLGGQLEEGIGRVTGDTRTQVRGAARQAEGVLQDLTGQARDTAKQAARTVRAGAGEADEYVRQHIEGRPYMVAAVALGLGFILGRMSGRH
jgi:uncharacterized protein YjbJ (UPF0337 family)